jgi:Leucine-rich repeat (LRR) protein
VGNWRNNTIWFEQIPVQLQACLNLKEDKFNKTQLEDIQYLTLWHHKKNKLGNFVGFPEALLYLELNWSNIENFLGIEKMINLKRLELHYCTKLQNDLGLAGLADTLEHLHINQSKKILLSEELSSLKNLRVLCLNSCGTLEILNFLYHFPNLIDFRFVDTNVLDGDLTPILNHPTIRSVGFLNKRHYNIKDDKMDDLLKDKNNGVEFKTVIKYGQYETFRYIN